MPNPRTLEFTPLDAIVPASRNPKLHDVQNTLASMERFGYIEPVIVDERTGRLIAGHGRLETLAAYKALIDSGATDPESGEPYAPPDGVRVSARGQWQVPTIRGWRSADDAEADAAAIALNRSPERGGWDERLLGEMLDELASSGLMHGVGFSESEMAEVRRRAGLLAEEATAFLGDLATTQDAGAVVPDGIVSAMPGQMVSAFSLPMSVPERDEAMRIVRSAQAECGGATMADALLWLLRQWQPNR